MINAYRINKLFWVFCIWVSVCVNLQALSPAEQLVEAARARTQQSVIYDGAYQVLAYPMGDVAADRGVCTDLVIRAYRAGLGVDLQQHVHEDMTRFFDQYPKRWGLTKADSNIDHRRVPNLQTYFNRQGYSLAVSNSPQNYRAGDLVSWNLPGNLPHIGIVSNRRSRDAQRPLIIHNIGAGPEEEDALFMANITGHYRFLPQAQRPADVQVADE